MNTVARRKVRVDYVIDSMNLWQALRQLLRQLEYLSKTLLSRSLKRQLRMVHNTPKVISTTDISPSETR